ncbi:RCC1 domain-containing protein [Sandaracinus amylolyticus]|uniref:RCC1 domain-containing protein n=1 Tax=Sandaracinus amylolyticus TaxID=927083 RepID=UPI001F387139|nr:hypothetical protein [Sandaracinus amylolyticus]
MSSRPISLDFDTPSPLVELDGWHALLADGSVLRASFGVTMDASGSTRSVPVLARIALDPVDALATGGGGACARLASDSTLRCWGPNTSGELGDGTVMPRSGPVAVVDLGRVRTFDVGYRHACAVTPSGEVRCWGLNDTGQLGDGTVVPRTRPVRVTAPPLR